MESSFTVQEFKTALAMFPSGVTVVTALDGAGRPVGFTASSFTSVSLAPPLILVCLSKGSSNYNLFMRTDSFAINVLSDQQSAISSKFASKSVDRFAGVEWHADLGGAPMLANTAASFDCTAHDRVDAGDHIVLIGRVLRCKSRPARPLGYMRGAYFTPSAELGAIRQRVGAILETRDRVALVEIRDAVFDLPSARKLLPVEDTGSLLSVLKAQGIDAEIDFLFSVFETVDKDEHCISVVYRGRINSRSSAAGNVRIVPIADILNLNYVDPATEAMLRRFTKERDGASFGVYSGDSVRGHIRPLANIDIAKQARPGLTTANSSCAESPPVLGAASTAS